MFFKRHPKLFRITLWVVVITLGLYLCLTVIGTLLAMELPRVPVLETPSKVGLDYRDVSFNSRDPEITLKGWFLPASGSNVIVIVHGGYQNRVDPLVDTLDLTRDLVNRGYNVLLFDLRGRGESGGKAHSLMYEDRDIGGAVDYLKTLGYAPLKIGIIGYCSGAASTSLYASREEVGGIVLDGCFATLHNMVTHQAARYGIPQWILDIFYNGLIITAKTIYRFQPLNPIEMVPEISSPILFIHEGNDVLVTEADDRKLLSVAHNPASNMWEVRGVKHSEAYHTYPLQYVDKLDAFFRTVLK
ncbi:MAG: alpha/beta fold hydrolase [Dehalococcoidales bacterium]|nr:alpha/beta fold hydrolase [Dehalococcoidales bacterium]